MVRHLVKSLVGRSPRTFLGAASSRGVKQSVARALEPAAKQLFGDRPEEVLTSRSAFEKAAMHTVIGYAGNLELSFGLVDLLASTVEVLGLARASDVPDPFRRVWISNAAGVRKRGVVLRCEQGEVAVFCPPSLRRRWRQRKRLERQPVVPEASRASTPGLGRRFTDAGDIMKMSYRGFVSSVEYELRLNDAVRLPGALVLHLNRPDGGGAIGRDDRRVDVRLEGVVRPVGNVEPGTGAEPSACQVLDVSSGGLRIASDLGFEKDQEVELELRLPDGIEQPLSLTALICWNRSDDSGNRTQGLQISAASDSDSARYRSYVKALLPAVPTPENEPDQDSSTLPTTLEKLEALRVRLLEYPSEVERLLLHIEELQASLDATARRASARKLDLEGVSAAVPHFKRLLDEIEDNLSSGA